MSEKTCLWRNLTSIALPDIYPDYLVIIRELLNYKLGTKAFELAADNLRNEALLKPIPDEKGVDWEDIDDLSKLKTFTIQSTMSFPSSWLCKLLSKNLPLV